MLRSILVALGAALCLLAFAALGELPGGAIARAVTAVALGTSVTALIYGEVTFFAVTLGALSPLAFAAQSIASDALAAGAMCLLWLVPRFVLADSRRKLVAVVAVSVVAAGIAGAIFAAYRGAPLAPHAASCVFAGSCLSLVGTIVPLSTTTGYALQTTAAVIEGPTRDTLMRAARAHERARWQRRTSVARKQWRALVRLSDRRAALERSAGAETAEQCREVDERIHAMARELAPVFEEVGPKESDTAELEIRVERPLEEPSVEPAETRPAPPTEA